MKRRAFLAASIAILTAPLAAEAQPAGKMWRIGYLASGSGPETNRPTFEGFHQGLRDLGWIPGKNVTIEYRWAEGQSDRLPKLASELVRLNVDILYVVALPAAFAAKRATSTIPIVFVVLGDPVSAGLVAGLARPGGNVTGVGGMMLELSAKRLELLKEIVPDLRRVAVLVNPSAPMTAPMMRETHSAARTLGIRLQVLEVREPSGIAEAFMAMDRERPDGLVVLQAPIFIGSRREILHLVTKRRLPAIYGESGWAPAGGLMGYAPNGPDMHRRGAVYVDRILKGAKPGDLPIEQPTKFELVINLKTAKALGLTIPPSILARADQVIQ